VDFRHDEWGNLVAAARADRETGTVSDIYEYTSSDPVDRHQLVSATPHAEGRTAYAYGVTPVPTEPSTGGWDPREPVVSVAPPAGDPTRFTYDRSQAPAGRFRTEIHAADGSVTRYLLNSDGNPLEIDEPSGVARSVTRLTWDPAHVVKTSEQHADGRSLSWAYDDLGNLVLEREREGPGAPPRTTTWTYDQRFNELVEKVDADGRRSTWTLDPRTGDHLSEELPDGATTWAYDDAGCLSEQRDADGRTLFRRPDTFCNPTEIHSPDGSVVRRRYDARGRLMDETTTPPR
jgi:YD repeat-containing protein